MPRTALVVEDDAAIRALICAALATENCAVVEAADGNTGLEAAARTRPDVILLDIGLPDIDGLAVLQTLKHDDVLRSIPVVMVTAWQDPDMVRQAMDRGAADYVCKPFGVDDLLLRVDATLTDPEPASTGTDGGLPDRSHLAVVLARQAAAARRTNRPFAIVLADLDEADTLITTHGDEVVSEDVLRAMAKRFRLSGGVSDVMVRYDTHTLALVLPGADFQAAMSRAEELRGALAAAPLDTPTALIAATGCFGVAAHESTEHPDDTLGRAADALCNAMAHGCDAIHGDEPLGPLPLL